jgi:hypothetical protein
VSPCDPVMHTHHAGNGSTAASVRGTSGGWQLVRHSFPKKLKHCWCFRGFRLPSNLLADYKKQYIVPPSSPSLGWGFSEE